MRYPPGKLERKWTTVRGLKMYYRVSVDPSPASNEPFVLVHGLAVSSRYMTPTALHMASHYRAYEPDLLGSGRSDDPSYVPTIAGLADILVEWMDATGLTEANFLGNSLGCQIIAQLARRHPDRILRAVLTGPTMDRHARTMRQEIGRWFLDIPFEPPSLYPIVLHDFLDISLRRVLRTLRYGLEDKIEEHLPFMQIPTLVIRGSRDAIVPQRWVEEITEMLPQGELLVLPKAAHAINYNSPRELTEAIRDFVARTAKNTTLPQPRLAEKP